MDQDLINQADDQMINFLAIEEYENEDVTFDD